jgi:lipopolysaccharide exporter
MTEPRGGSLTASVARGLGWTGTGLLLTSLLQLVYTAVMSRLLIPADFGVVAAALLSLRFVTYLSRFGLGSAVVQRVSLNRHEITVAQSVAFLTGSCVAIAVAVASPLLARLVGQPHSAGVIRWMSISLVVGAVTGVPEALLRRRLQFRDVALCQVSSFAIGYMLVGITLAKRGWGANSLVAATLSQAVIYLVLVTFRSKPPLRFTVKWSHARELLAFGGTVTVVGFLEFLQSSLDTLSVSRWIGSTGLGQYSRATYLVGLPVDQGVTAATRVLLPTFSQVQTDPTRFCRGYLMSSGPLAAMVMVPIAMVGVAASSVVSVVLGSGWDQAASVLPIVGAAYGFNLLTLLPAAATEAKGKVRPKLVLQATSLLVTAAFMGVAIGLGPTLQRVAFAWLLGEIVRHLLYWVYGLPLLGIPRIGVGRRYLAAASMAIAGSLPLLLFVRVLRHTTLPYLLAGGLLGLVLAAATGASPPCRVIVSDVKQIKSNLSDRPVSAIL